MTQAEFIISKFGGLTKLANALGHARPSTVQGWKERGYIPARHQDDVLAAAAAHGLDIKPDDFFGHQAAV